MNFIWRLVQYVGGADNTVPFEPGSAVTDALNLIKKRTEQALGHERDFNEVLSAAYMEKQKMAVSFCITFWLQPDASPPLLVS